MFSSIFTFIKSKIPFIASSLPSDSEEPVTTNIVTKQKSSEPCWQRWFPFSFFYGNGKFQPIYFFVTLFSFLSAWMMYIKCHAASIAVKMGTFTPDMISTADLATIFGFVGSLIILYNGNKKNTTQTYKPPVITNSESDKKIPD